MIKKYLLKIFLLISFLFFFNKKVFALKYSLIAPSGTLERNNNYEFIINIDTQGESITNGIIGMNYDTQYLEYVTINPGETMTSISTSQPENGKLIITGNNNAGFSGTGTFAKVTFKLIAGAPGETELCVLWNPESEPTPTSEITPTTIIQPTSLPKTGAVKKTMIITTFGAFFLIIFGISYFFIKKIFIENF